MMLKHINVQKGPIVVGNFHVTSIMSLMNWTILFRRPTTRELRTSTPHISVNLYEADSRSFDSSVKPLDPTSLAQKLPICH